MNEWKQLFRENRHAQLALLLRGSARGPEVRCLGDDEVVLLGGAEGGGRQPRRLPRDREVLSVVLTPGKEQNKDEFAGLLQSARKEHPRAEFTGHAGCWNEEMFDCLCLKLGLAGKTFEPEKLEIPSNKPLIAVLSYSPEVEPEALEQACLAAKELPNLQSVVALPLGAGDRIPLKGFTTSGTSDVMVVSVLRHFLSAETRIRASWAALGWKVAQMALVYGADELVGWSAAESLVYGPRVRSAARVERDEVELGVAEASLVFKPWLALEEAAR